LDLHELRDWEEEDHQIEEDVDAAVDVDGELEVVAVAFVFSVPLLLKVSPVFDDLPLGFSLLTRQKNEIGLHWKLEGVEVSNCPLSELNLHLLPAVYQEAYAVSNQPGDDGPADVGEPRGDCFREDSKI
jgi:hypothetical protein